MALNSRNYPPEHGIRVPAAVQQAHVTDLLGAAGLEPEGASLVAGFLVDCDRRCVFSHGTRQAPGYIRMIRDGRVNPRPEIRTVSDLSCSVERGKATSLSAKHVPWTSWAPTTFGTSSLVR